MESNTTPAIIALTHVHELARKLGAHLDEPSQIDICRALAEEILALVERAIFVAGRGDSPISSSRWNYVSDQRTSKKRKTLPKWTSQVSASALKGPESLRDDGHTWRKYGQKEILNSKHPRAYYRCTHSKTHGCLATKQVQRSDDNLSVFNVTYRGTHTCTNSVHQTFPRCVEDLHQSLSEQKKNRRLDDLQTSLLEKADGLDFEAEDETYLLFDDMFSPSPNLDSCFPWSPYQYSSHINPSPELTDIIFAAASATNSQMLDVNFMHKTEELDTSYSINTTNFFNAFP